MEITEEELAKAHADDEWKPVDQVTYQTKESIQYTSSALILQDGQWYAIKVHNLHNEHGQAFKPPETMTTFEYEQFPYGIMRRFNGCLECVFHVRTPNQVTHVLPAADQIIQDAGARKISIREAQGLLQAIAVQCGVYYAFPHPTLVTVSPYAMRCDDEHDPPPERPTYVEM